MAVKFYDGNPINSLARDEGSLARIISKKMTNLNSLELKALMTTLLGQAVGSTATATKPYIVQATDGKTGGLVTIGTQTVVSRATTAEDKNNIYSLLHNGATSIFDTGSLLGISFRLGTSRLGG